MTGPDLQLSLGVLGVVVFCLCLALLVAAFWIDRVSRRLLDLETDITYLGIMALGPDTETRLAAAHRFAEARGWREAEAAPADAEGEA